MVPRRRAYVGGAGSFSIVPAVMLDNDASETSTVIEASGRDRPGLLAALARTIADAGLSILSAHIDGYGELAALIEPDAEPATGRRTGLQRARASVAR